MLGMQKMVGNIFRCSFFQLQSLRNSILTSLPFADEPIGIMINVTSPVQETSATDVSQDKNRPCNIFAYRDEKLAMMLSTDVSKDDSKSNCWNNLSNVAVQNVSAFIEPMSNEQYGSVDLKKDTPVKDGLFRAAKSSHVNDASNVETSSLWELSLRRPDGCMQPDLKEKQFLKHSVASAFSR